MGAGPQETGPATDSDPGETALALSREMLAAARRSEWDTVVALEAKRRGMLENLFAGGVPAARAERVAATAREVLALDRELSGLVRAACQRVGGDLQALRLARHAAGAYRSCAGAG